MKNLNIKNNPALWLAVYALSATITIIILSVKISGHHCPKPNLERVEAIIEKSKNQIEHYEKIIAQDSAIIWNSSQCELDSLRSIRFLKYMQ